MKIKKSRIYTKKIFCELLGIVLNIRMINNTLMIVNKKKCIEDHAYYKFSSINNKKYLTVKMFNPRMYLLSPEGYHFDFIKYEIKIDTKDKKYNSLTFTIIENIDIKNIKIISDCLYTSGAARVENYTTYLKTILK